MLANGKIVAVKKSKVIDDLIILSQINHRNVIKLLGCCLDTEAPLLVYEFVPNGTLYDYLHDPNAEFPISWGVRFQIASEVAGALFYLHSAATVPIYHRDVKTRNILLDEKYQAKLADFGTSISVGLDQTHVSTLVRGTFGYLGPEYFESSQYTDKSDVYSFGVVLVELLTGQKPISSLRALEGRSLATNFILSMQHGNLSDILDEQVLEQAPKEEVEAVADLARRCLNSSGNQRPTMKEVAVQLEGIRKVSHPLKIKQTENAMEFVLSDRATERSDGLFTSSRFELIATDTSMTSDVHPLRYGETW
ncbi:hypothetical protein CDL15_Pgr002963 [Punica granatum]|uniref:Protein kinase domain-containing protein n=1 Tax=Punica granatum TaxID=22663 RepID=A0A218X347_PUNGR|nr:hypothetical protein CDL15_Pgr002963 [Punica granatum]